MNAINPLGPASVSGGDQRSYEPTMEEILASIRRIIADDQGATNARPAIVEPTREPEAANHPATSLHVLRSEPDQGFEGSEPSFETASASAAPVPSAPMVSHGYVAAPQYPTPDAFVPAEHQPRNEHQFRNEHNVRNEHTGESSAAEPFTAEAGPVHVPEPRSAAPAEARHEHEPAIPPAHFPELPHQQNDDPQSALQLFSAQTKQSVASAFNALAATRLADNSDELLVVAREMMRPMLKAWLDDNLPTMVERLVRAEIERVARGR